VRAQNAKHRRLARPDGITDVRFYPQQLADTAAQLQVRVRWAAGGVDAESPADSDTSTGCDMFIDVDKA
jgi:hypothetical protein